MKRSKHVYTTTCLLTAALLGLATIRSSAQQAQDIPLVVKLQLSAAVQVADQGDNNGVDKILASSAKVSSQTMFNQASLTLTAGIIALANGTAVGSLTPGTQVVGGQTFDNGKQNSTITASMTISLDNGNGTSCNLTGVAKELYSLTTADANGNQTERDSLNITVVGDGTVAGAPAVFSGKISIMGSGKPATTTGGTGTGGKQLKGLHFPHAQPSGKLVRSAKGA